MKILITGASQGLGEAIATQLAQKGHSLILIARNKEKLERISEKLSLNTTVKIIAADLSLTSSIKNIAESFTKEDSPDVLINNLGIFRPGKASNLKIEEIKAQLELNLYVAVQLTNELLPHFKAKGKGQVFNIGSVASHSAISTSAAYSISKHALKAWNDSLREEVREDGIKVTSIFPSSINTSSWKGVKGVDTSKMIQKEDIAQLIATMIELGDATLIEEVRLSPLQNFFL